MGTGRSSNGGAGWSRAGLSPGGAGGEGGDRGEWGGCAVGLVRVSVPGGIRQRGGRLGRPVRAAEASWATWPSGVGGFLLFYFCFVFLLLVFYFIFYIILFYKIYK